MKRVNKTIKRKEKNHELDGHYFRCLDAAEWLRLVCLGPQVQAGSEEPEGGQPPEGYGAGHALRGAVREEHRRTPAAGSQGIARRSERATRCGTKD